MNYILSLYMIIMKKMTVEVFIFIFFFFFSSRRRHTRSLCDWSSDVCSSDLYMLPKIVEAWRELGENYTSDRADVELIRHTTVRKKTVGDQLWILKLEDLDREMMKQWIDEVTIFASINLHIAL